MTLALSPFARFLITGGVAAAVNVLSRLALSFAMPFEAAVVVAYLVGMTTAWVLARLFVFAPTGRSATGEYARFVLVNAVALAQVWLVSVGLSRLLFPAIGFGWNADLVAHLIGVASPVATSYYGHKLFTFRRSGE